MATPSELLQGLDVDGWRVDSTIGTFPGMTGGHFSTGYFVSRGDVRAFMKAMDLHQASNIGLDAIADATHQFRFERELLTFCQDRRLSHVVRMLECGEFQHPGVVPGLPSNLNTVYYMVFERSDGDIRRELAFGGSALASWKLFILHQATIGLSQLHNSRITHQDLKPSNVLGFKKLIYKLGDLGRSSAAHMNSPAMAFDFPGDLSYAPPEYQYGYVPTDTYSQRQGSDAYLLGSLASFLFLGVGAITLTLGHVEEKYSPDRWKGSYPEVLPYLENAHTDVCGILETSVPTTCQADLKRAYFELCHPNPLVRGHPRTRRNGTGLIGLDRYVSLFDRLRQAVAISERMGQA